MAALPLDTFSPRVVFPCIREAGTGGSTAPPLPELADGGSGCPRIPPPFTMAPGDGDEGGGTEPPPADEPDPTDPTPATAVVVVEPAPPALAADPVPAAALPPPANALTAATAAPPTASAALPTTAAVATRSPPVNAGEPPITAANSFGICQQHIMNMSDPPITSNAVMTGRADAAMDCASSIQPRLRPNPAEIRQYSSRILMPMETARPMYRSV